MQDYVVRDAVENDAKGIVEAHSAAIREKAIGYYSTEVIEAWSPVEIRPGRVERMKEQIRGTDFYTIVAQANDGTILGFGQVSPLHNKLGAVYVRRNSFHGVGKSLVQRLLEYARKNGCHYLEMDSSLNAESFYKNAGFKVVESGMHRLWSGIDMKCVKMRIDL